MIRSTNPTTTAVPYLWQPIQGHLKYLKERAAECSTSTPDVSNHSGRDVTGGIVAVEEPFGGKWDLGRIWGEDQRVIRCRVLVLITLSFLMMLQGLYLWRQTDPGSVLPESASPNVLLDSEGKWVADQCAWGDEKPLISSPWLAANEMTFPFREFKWLIEPSAFCAKCLCLFGALWGALHQRWYRRKGGPQTDEFARPLSSEAEVLSASHTWVSMRIIYCVHIPEWTPHKS